MDISIAGTIYQSQSLWITGAIGIIGAAVGGGATYLIERQKIKDNEKQRMQQIYGELMGRKYMLLQSYASYYNALINTNHANLRSIINAISTVDYDSIKSFRMMLATRSLIELSMKPVRIQLNSKEHKKSKKEAGI